MNFSFSLGHHSDIIIGTEPPQNWGYNHIFRLPAFLWVAHLQATRRNLFKTRRLPNPYYRAEGGDSHEVEDVIRDTLGLAEKLPIDIGSFNLETQLARLSDFSDGTNRTSYLFSLAEDNSLTLTARYQEKTKDQICLSLNPKERTSLLWAYLNFMGREERLEGCRSRMKNVFTELREFGRR
ncbi:MAG: hypothetical protein ABIG28_00400 [archaeon]